MILKDCLTALFEQNFSIFPPAGRIDCKADLTAVCCQINRGVDRRIFDAAHFFIGHEILFECLFFKGFQPGKIGLVIRKYPGHQLYVRAVLIR